MFLAKSRYGPKDRSVLGAEANVQTRTDESERQWGTVEMFLLLLLFSSEPSDDFLSVSFSVTLASFNLRHYPHLGLF
jgi:hypothetical protein